GRAAGGPVPVWRVGRGGEVTWHGPGQLVGYPVLGLMGLRRDVHRYLRRLASIGVAVRRWVTWHGFALNVSPDLSGFEAITPCGLRGVEMTSVAREGGPDDVGVVALCVLARLVAIFGYTGWRPLASGAPTEARL